MLVAAASLSVGLAPRARAANFFWDTNSSTSGLGSAGGLGADWDTTTANWFNAGTSTSVPDGTGSTSTAAFTSNDIAYFAGTSGTVTLTAPITVGGLNFGVGGYAIASSTSANTLTLVAPTGSNSPVITVTNNGSGTNRATISAALAGTSGFTKSGNGSLVLTANNSGLGGDIAIKGGSVIITAANQLGATTGTAISVTGIAGTGNPGFSGGSLILQGTASGAGAIAGTVNLGREVSISGRGPGAANSTGSLISIGYNTLAGGLTIGAPASQGRAWATHGTTTISGNLFLVGGVGDSSLFYGNGNWNVSGQVSGVEASNDRFLKAGNLIASTMWLQSANNNFAQSLRVDSGTVRVQSNGALGINTGTGQIDLNNGTIEIRTDAAAGFSGRTVRVRNNTTGTIFVDHDLSGGLGIGSSLQNQTVAMGALSRDTGANPGNFTFNGRNGYSMSFTTAPAAGDYRGITVTNNSSGTVTLNGNVFNANNATAATFTVAGNGEFVITGNVLGTGGAQALTKSGTGTFTYGGTAGTYTGATTINAGTLSFSNVGAFAGTSGISIGNATTTAGALTYTGAAATLSKPITINTTGANAYINASGSGALTLSGGVTATLTTAKTLVLGGTSTADNTITSAIPNAGTSVLSLQKIGLGTWVLGGAVSNTFTGSTTVSGGTLKLTDGTSINLLPDAGAVIFGTDVFTNAAGGALIYTGGANAETVGALTGTSGHGVVTAVSGTLTFASLGTRTAGSSIDVSNTGTVNVTGTSGFVNAGTYFNGADFAFSGAGTTLRAPVYGTDAGFVDAAAGTATLTAASHNRITGAITAQTTAAVNSLKIDGANNLTLASGQTLTVGVGAAAAGAGILLTGGSSTISGGTAIAASAAGNDFSIRVEGANTLTISTPLTTSTAGLTKSGAGTLVLGGANTFSGTVAVNEGTLQMASGGLLGATGVGLAVRQGATFDLNGVNVGTSASGTNAVNLLTGAGTITNTSGTLSTLRIGEGGTSGALYTGLLTGNLALVKAGSGTSAGTFHLTGLNTFTGPVTLIAGNLDVTRLANIGQPSGIGAGDATSAATNAASLVFNGGNLRYVGTNASGALEATQTPSVSIDRLFTLAGSGGIFSFGSYGNNVQVRAANNASLIFNSTADVVFSGAGTRTFTLGGDSIGDNELRVRLLNNTNANEALSLTVSGGLWILNPATSNTYTGATTISGGALRAVVSGSVLGIPTNSNITLSGGVLQVAGTSFTRTLGTGAGQVQLTAGDTGFAAGTTDRLVVTLSSGGALTWGSGSFNPVTSLVLGSSTALGETEITNNINLGTAARTITVNNNGNTGTMVTAGILSGVISGGSTAGTLIKAGGGVLILGNANTYTGTTTVTGGNIIVTSIGGGGSASSLGAGSGATGAFIFNPGDSDLNPLIYVGTGETATRNLTLTSSADHGTTTRQYRVVADGSGPLIWAPGTFTNSVRAGGASRFITLDLRGASVENNQMNAVLTDSTGTNTPKLNVLKSDGGTWILNPASNNTFTGSITAGGGNLGLTANGIGSASSIILSNASIFGFGGALTTSTGLTLANNTTAVFSGQNAITFNAAVTKASGANDQTFSNNLEGGALLTINGNFVNGEDPTSIATRIINVRGFGSTLWNGVIADNSSVSGGTRGSRTSWNIAIHPDATFTTSGAANTYTGGTTLTDGILVLDKTSSPLGVSTSASTGVFTFSGGTLRAGSSVANLSGANAITNPVTLGGSPPKVDGTKSIEFSGVVGMAASRTLQNELTGAAELILSGGITNTAVSTLTVFGAGTTRVSGVYAAGTGANAFTMSGTGTTILSAANLATGALTANRGVTVLSGAGGAWTAGTLAINAGGTLRLDNSGTNNNDRLFNTGAFTMSGGTLDFIGNGTVEVAGALTVNLIDASIAMSGSGTNSLTFASATFSNTGSSLDLSGIGANSFIFTTAPTAVGGLQPRIFLGGADFAVSANASPITAFNAYSAATDLNVGAITDTFKLGAAFVTDDLAFSRTVNAVSLSDTTARTLGLSAGVGDATLTLTSGGIIAGGGVTHTLAVPRLSLGTNGFIQTVTGSTLDISGAITNASGSLMKGLPGTLRLSNRQWYNATTSVGAGTLVLNGGNNTVFPGSSAQFIVDAGATLDLNGTVQYMPNSIRSAGADLPGSGGTITGAGGMLVLGPAATTWGGTLTGTGLSLVRTGSTSTTTTTFTLEQAQTYTGSTTILGGTVLLENDATLLSTSSIDINQATLSLSNNSGLQTQNNDRIGDSIPITMRGGSVSYTGRLSSAATETFGAVTLDQGANTITANTGGGTFTSVDLTFASLTRLNNATINFTGTNLGQSGNNARIVFTSPIPTTNGGMIGAWAIANQSDYAAYNTGLGVGVVGQGGFVGYDGVSGSGMLWQIPATAATTTTLPAGTTNAAVLRLAGAFNNDIAFTNAGDVLNLELGGLLRSNENASSSIGTTAVRGVLTSGVGELVAYSSQGTLTINSVIQGSTRLVKDGPGTLTLTAPNTYGLGTFINRGTTNISPTTPGDVVIPSGGLTISGGVTGGGPAVNLTASNAIAADTDLTMRGASSLTFSASVNQTLRSIAFDSNGGTAGPTLTVTGTLAVTGASPITATSTNAAAPATITGGTVALASGVNTFSVAPVAVGGTTYTDIHPTLSIASLISGAGASVTKTGNGLLQLSGASTFTGGMTVSGGGLIIGAAGTGIAAGTGAAAVTGPVGAGALTMAAGTRLLVDNASRTFYNPVTFVGTPTFSNTNVGTNVTLTLGGAITPPSDALAVSIDNPFLTVALAGPLNNAATISSISKTGLGNLTLNYTGISSSVATTLSGGGTLGILHDGDGDVQSDVISIGAITGLSRPASITVGRAGATALWNQAINKVIAPASLTDQISGGLSVTNNNQYQLRVADSFALASTVNGAAPVFNVSTASNSNTLSGLRLTGVISGGATGSSAVALTKTGNGTLDLTGTNTFGGGGSILDVTGGVLAVTGNAALGDASNVVRLSANSGTQGLRLINDGTTTSYTLTGRTINLNAATVGIDVSAGTTVTLDTPFSLSAANNVLQKNDLGTLIVSASNSAHTGGITVNGGSVRPGVDDAFGGASGSVRVAGVLGAAVELTGGSNVATPINLNTSGSVNLPAGGINFGGQLSNVSGTNTWSGAINMTADAGIGALSGTLNITGGVSMQSSTARAVYFNPQGASTINVNTTALANGAASSWHRLEKHGSGTLNVTTANTGLTFSGNSNSAAVSILGGTFALSGAGGFNTAAWTTNTIFASNGSTLLLDNVGTNVTQRTTGGGAANYRALNLVNATLEFRANGGSASSETFGALTSTWGGNTITLNNAGASNATLTFANLASNAVSGGSVLRLNSAQSLGPSTNRLIITTTPTLTGNLIPRAVITDVGGANFATNAVAATPTASTTNGSNVVTLTTGNTFQMVVGQSVTNANITGTVTAITGPCWTGSPSPAPASPVEHAPRRPARSVRETRSLPAT